MPGLGTTIDVILVNGKLREGDTIVVAGIEGPIVTQIRALLTPQPLKELRVKNQYINHKELPGAQGVKIAAKDLEKALAGIPLFVAQQPDEVDFFKVNRRCWRRIFEFSLPKTSIYFSQFHFDKIYR